jgi:hypothetical protein
VTILRVNALEYNTEIRASRKTIELRTKKKQHRSFANTETVDMNVNAGP